MGVKEIFMEMNRAAGIVPSVPSSKPIIHEYDKFHCTKKNCETTIDVCLEEYRDANLDEDGKGSSTNPCHRCRKGMLNRKHFAES